MNYYINVDEDIKTKKNSSTYYIKNILYLFFILFSIIIFMLICSLPIIFIYHLFIKNPINEKPNISLVIINAKVWIEDGIEVETGSKMKKKYEEAIAISTDGKSK